VTGQGIERLVEIVRERELADGEVLKLAIPNDQGRLLALLHELAEVYEERSDERATMVTAWVPRNSIHSFAQFSLSYSQKRAKVS